MSRVQPFEELVAWQKSRQLARHIYEITRHGQLKSDFGFTRQMQRCAVSIMSNIAEGYERGGDGDYMRFLSIAKGSCAELRSQLYLAHDVGYLDRQNFGQLLEQVQEVGRIIGGLRAFVQRRRDGQA